MSAGKRAMSKKSALRRWISRFVMPVAMLAGSTDTATQERAGSFSLRSMALLKRVKVPWTVNSLSLRMAKPICERVGSIFQVIVGLLSTWAFERSVAGNLSRRRRAPSRGYAQQAQDQDGDAGDAFKDLHRRLGLLQHGRARLVRSPSHTRTDTNSDTIASN